jgi:ribosomal protein S10
MKGNVHYKINIKNHSKLNLSKFQKKLFFQLSKFLNMPLTYKAMPYNKASKYTVNRSPFIFSRSKEQFEIFWYQRILNVSFKGLKKENLAYQNKTLLYFTELNEVLQGLELKITKKQSNFYKFKQK